MLAGQLTDADNLNLSQGKHFVYWFFSSGLVTIMLFIKCYYGFKFLWFSSRGYERRVADRNIKNAQQRQTSGVITIGNSSNIDEHLEHRTRKMVLKDQRRQLNYFFIASTVYYIFLLILILCLIPVVVAINLIEHLDK